MYYLIIFIHFYDVWVNFILFQGKVHQKTRMDYAASATESLEAKLSFAFVVFAIPYIFSRQSILFLPHQKHMAMHLFSPIGVPCAFGGGDGNCTHVLSVSNVYQHCNYYLYMFWCVYKVFYKSIWRFSIAHIEFLNVCRSNIYIQFIKLFF